MLVLLEAIELLGLPGTFGSELRVGVLLKKPERMSPTFAGEAPPQTLVSWTVILKVTYGLGSIRK